MVAGMEGQRHLAATEAFFAPKAAGWEKRFPDDGPVYRQAIAELAPRVGGVALDAGCGTGRALPALRDAVGPSGAVIGVDVTAAMLAEAGRLGRRAAGALVRGDTGRLPLPDGAADAVFAAGLLPHCPDLAAALLELARVTRVGGRVAIFHPIGRAALAARHGNVASDEDAVAPRRLTPVLEATGFRLVLMDDSEHRYLALAERSPSKASPPLS
jgi:SAM-dependent methyltransferase